MISRRACFMPSLGRFKEIFWNQDSLTRQGRRRRRDMGSTLLPHASRPSPENVTPFHFLSPGCSPDAGSIFRLSQNATTVFSPDFPRPWELRQEKKSRYAAARQRPHFERSCPSLPSQPSHVIGLFFVFALQQGTPPPTHTVSITFPVSVSCRVSCRFGRIGDAHREKNGVCHGRFSSICHLGRCWFFFSVLLPVDLSSLTDRFSFW